MSLDAFHINVTIRPSRRLRLAVAVFPRILRACLLPVEAAAVLFPRFARPRLTITLDVPAAP